MEATSVLWILVRLEARTSETPLFHGCPEMRVPLNNPNFHGVFHEINHIHFGVSQFLEMNLLKQILIVILTRSNYGALTWNGAKAEFLWALGHLEFPGSRCGPGFHENRGVPQARWMVYLWENCPKMETGGTPILGNFHVYKSQNFPLLFLFPLFPLLFYSFLGSFLLPYYSLRSSIFPYSFICSLYSIPFFP